MIVSMLHYPISYNNAMWIFFHINVFLEVNFKKKPSECIFSILNKVFKWEK